MVASVEYFSHLHFVHQSFVRRQNPIQYVFTPLPCCLFNMLLKADYDLVRLKMRGKDLKRRKKDASVNESWNLLKKSLNKVIEETIPRAVGMVKKRPWVTRKVQKKRRAKQRAWRKYSKLKKENEVSNSDLADQIRELKQKYVEKRNLSNRANRKAVKDYENKLAANVKSDSKSFYKYVRSRQRKKDRVG